MVRTASRPTAVRRGPGGVGALAAVGIAVAALVAAALTLLTGSRPVGSLGLPDPGALVTVGLPVVRTVTELAGMLTLGGLLLAAFLVAPQRSGYLDVTGYRAARTAAAMGAVWTAGAILMVPLTAADAVGRPLGDVLDLPILLDVIPRLAVTTAWTVTAVLALAATVAAATTLTWGWSVAGTALALLGPLPVAVTGHSASGGSHDLATDSLLLHVVAAAVWVGGLLAVLGVAAVRSARGQLAVAVPRFSRLAGVCWTLLAFTGVVNVLVRLPLSELLGSTYGALVLAKVAALVALGVAGAWHRRVSVPAAKTGDGRALLRLGAGEFLLMGATVGLAVALGRTAPPADAVAPPSRTEVLIGYDLTGPPTLLRLLVDWRVDLVFALLAGALAVGYLAGVRRLRRRGDAWPVGRSIAFLAGCAVLLVATSSGIGRYAPAMFSVHMGMHMLLSMLVPILLVLGAPVTLALRALRPAGRDGPPGPREWLLAAVHSRPARWLTHPLVVLPLYVGGYFALYFSGLFAAALTQHWAHLLMNLHFLVTGLLFFWPVVGVDPAPRRLPAVVRLAMVFVSLPFHAFFGVALMSGSTLIGGRFYQALALPWVADPLRDQQIGGGLAWASGELPVLLVVIALLIQWSRDDDRAARRADRHADADGDADLAAYNAMLHRLATENDRPAGAGRGPAGPGDAGAP